MSDNSKKERSEVEATGAALTEDVSRLKKDVTQLGSHAKAHGQAHIDAAQERFNKAIEAAKEQVTSRPLLILGVGLALGYVFGRRGRRRRHSE